MNSKEFESIMKAIKPLRETARLECGNYIQELIYYVEKAVVEAYKEGKAE